MVAEWVACLDKRPADRTGEDLDIIYSRLKDAKAFEKFHPMLLQQICYYGYYEDLEKGITLFRQGDLGANWYAVLAGSLDVHVSDTGDTKDSITLCTLGIGTAFGESVLDDSPRHATIITSEPCELLRVEQKDFKLLWERNKQFMEGVLTPLSSQLPEVGVCHDGSNKKPTNNEPASTTSPPKPTIHTTPTKKAELPKEPPNPALPITEVPSEKLAHAGKVIRTVILSRAPHMIRDRKYHLRTYRRCMVGTEMVDWLLQQGSWVHSRNQAVGMWQALLEEGVIANVTHEHQFKDKYLFYRFRDDDLGIGTMPTISERKEAEDELQETLSMLAQIGPDAMMRMILRKPPQERTSEDLEVIYEELLHIKALSHLSTMVKRELASVLVFESHPHSGTVLFNQGDEGKSWYIILKGSVNVVIYGKGVVCTLHEGDDFGKLALVNDAPRAATIVLREDNCHFLRVDKEDFNRILRDVEANTVRLKEHGQDVLVLEKIPTNTQEGGQSHYNTSAVMLSHMLLPLVIDDAKHAPSRWSTSPPKTNCRYSVMAGTPEKMLEHLLETRIDCKTEDTSDTFQEDFLLTYEIFMPSSQLCPALMAHYMTEAVVTTEQENDEFILANKKRVIKFVQLWADIARDALFEDIIVNTFLEELYEAVVEDNKIYGNLMDEVRTMQKIAEQRERYIDEQDKTKKRTKPTGVSHFRRLSKDFDERRKTIKASDETIFKVYCADHTYSTLKLPMDATAEMIKQCAAAKLCLGDDLLLVEVKATGEQVVIKEGEVSVPTGLSLNGRLFIAPREHLDALTPLPDQEGPQTGTASNLEMMSSREIAYQMTLFDWELFTCVHEYELIYHVFGRHKFAKIMSNLDMFMRRFNEVQYWIATEMCLTLAVSKRVQLLRKFIKIAAYCREYQNMNSFFAIVMGLSNIAISRLSQTWEKLPNKFKKLFGEFETLMDPSRNHRVYRLTVSKMAPPIIPFMPLLMKDMTFTHEGNKTYLEGLVNFEKMHMLAQTLRTIRYCRSKPLNIDPPPPVKNLNEIRNYIRSFSVIDNQRRLTQLSHRLEPRRS